YADRPAPAVWIHVGRRRTHHPHLNPKPPIGQPGVPPGPPACGTVRKMPLFKGCTAAFLSQLRVVKRSATTRAALTPEAPAWARPRVTPAPSPTAKKPGRAVSSWLDREMRAE